MRRYVYFHKNGREICHSFDDEKQVERFTSPAVVFSEEIADNDEAERRMTDPDVVTYLDLVNRRLILCATGKNWKPEYEQELEEIEKELAGLIPLVEKERATFEKRKREQEAGNESG